MTATHHVKRSEIFPLTGLREAYLFITNRCGMGCRHCFTSSVPETGVQELTTEAWLDILGQLRALGAESVVFVGGDPFARDDLLTLLDAATGEFGLDARIFFNRRLSAEVATDLARAGRGRLTVIASLDGPTAEINDRVRGAGSHAAALSAIGHLQAAGLNPVLNVVPTAVNVGYLTEMAELADRLGVERLQITLPLDRGFLRQARSLWPQSADLTRELRRLRVRAAGLRVRVENFAGWEDRLGRSFDYCSAAYDLVAFDDTGGVYPCQCAVGDPNLRAGTVGAGSLESIWRTADVFRWVRDASFRERAACRACPVALICGGDCILHGYFAEEARTGRGTLSAVTPHCETFKAIYEDLLTESGICLVDPGNPSLLKKT